MNTRKAKIKKLTFQLKHNQYIVIENLPAVGYTIEEIQESGYLSPNFFYDSETILENGTTEITCYNPVQLDSGDLQITKVINDTTNNNRAPKNQAFEFKVTLRNIAGTPTESYTVNYTCDPQKGTLSTVDGKITYTMTNGTSIELVTAVKPEEGLDGEYELTLTLYDGLTATIEDLPPCAYHVEENDYTKEGFVGSWTGNQTGMIGGKKTGDADPLAALTCTNTYPVNTNGVLMIKKQVTKDYERDVLPGDIFTFTVTPTDGNILEGQYTVKISEVNNEDAAAETMTVTASNNQLVVQIPYTAEELVMGLNDSKTKILTIEGLPLGQYDVAETADEDYRQSPDALKYSVYIGTNPGEAVFINRYKRHLGRLTIIKTVDGNPPADDIFIFHIKGKDTSNSHIDMDVTITGSGSVTVYDLPLGTYTVTEDTDWNWRYTTDSASASAELTVNDPDKTVTFANTYSESRWISFFWNCLNEFLAPKGDDE